MIRPAVTSVLRSRPASSGDRHLAAPTWQRVVATGWTMPLIALTIGASLLRSGGLVAAVAAIGIVVLPGGVTLAAAGLRPSSISMRLGAAAGLGAALLMLAGALMSAIGPVLGVDRPLDRPGVLIVVGSFTVLATVVSTRRGREPMSFLGAGSRIHPAGLWPLLLSFGGVAGALRLGSGHGAAVAVVAGGAGLAALVGLLITVWHHERSGRAVAGAEMVLFGATLGLLWATALRGQHLFGWDIQQEHERIVATLSSGRWTAPTTSDPYGAMGSITALPAMLVAVTGFSASDVLRWFFPLFLAVVPVATWSFARRRASATMALAATLLLVGLQMATLRSLPAIGRQEVALCMFAVGLAVGFDSSVALAQRRWFLAAMFSALAFTHYSTGYAACLMLIAALVVGRVITGPPAQRRPVVTTAVVLIAVIASVGWNLGIASSGDNLARVTDQLETDGLELLPGIAEEGILQGWLQGTAMAEIETARYAELVDELLADRLSWIEPMAVSADPAYDLVDLDVAEHPALIAGAAGPWTLVRTVVSQLVVVLSFASVVVGAAVLIRRRRQGIEVSANAAQVIAMGAGALLLGVVLRTSGTFGEVYNPERAAVQAGIVLAPAMAIAFDRVVRGRVAVFAVVALGVLIAGLDGSGWAKVVTGGGRPAALASIGEDAERNVLNAAELSTIEWLAATIDDKAIVQSDRYGQMALANADFTERDAALVDIVVPEGIDRSAWVYASRTNTRIGTARGAVSGEGITVFAWPEAYLSATKSVVYSTGDTRVYR